MAKINVDLQDGLAGHYVRIEFNEDVYYCANLTQLVSLAGPAASFITFLPRGLNQGSVYWGDDNNSSYSDNFEIFVGDSEEYYVSLNVSSDSTIIVELRDTPILYD